MKRFHVTTFGCQMNEHDSERMKGMLESLGYAEVPEREEADLILFNTCSIREKADERFVSHLYEARALKRRDPERVIGVGGCWAQSMKDRVFAQFPFVDVAFGPGQVHKLAEFLTSDSLTAQGFFEFEGFTGHLPGKRARDVHAWVQISAGCNMKCSFCIVPTTRGREVSRPFEELVDEVRALAAEGVREVTLLGQNVNSYGIRLRPQPRKFSELLYAIDAIDGIDRVRYTSPHPAHMREDVIRAHAELESVCQHIHLPLQSGSSRILKAMRRTYDRQRYLDRVALIREHVPDCAITTDIIVGFPGETEADFAETLEVVEEVGFDGAFTFIYSPRRDTEAAEFVDGSWTTTSPWSAWSGSSRSSSGAPASARSGSSGGRSTCSSRAPRATTRRACAAARRTTRSSTSTAWRRPARSSRSRSERQRARRSPEPNRWFRAPPDR